MKIKHLLITFLCLFSLNALAQDRERRSPYAAPIKEMNARNCYEYYTDKITDLLKIRGLKINENEHLTEAVKEYNRQRLECMQAANDGKKYPPVIK